MAVTGGFQGRELATPKPRDFFADMSAQECVIKSKVYERAISASDAAKQLNALGGVGWWSAGSCGLLQWDLDQNPMGPICGTCGDTGLVRRLGAACAECRACPKGNDLAAIIAIRREAMKLREEVEMEREETPVVPPRVKVTMAPPPPGMPDRGPMERAGFEHARAVMQGREAAMKDAILEPMELRHARMRVEDLRKKLDDARKELRYHRAIAPKGSRFVQGFVSSCKGRETPNHARQNVYVDGEKVSMVFEAYAGAEGFAVIAAGHDPTQRRLLTGIIHVVEFEGSPLDAPASLQFRP